MRIYLFPVLLILTSLACSVPGAVTPPTAPPLEMPPAAAQIDPRTLDTAGIEECTLISDAELSAILGETPSDKVSDAALGVAGCYYSFASGKTFSLGVTVDTPGRQVYDSVLQYLETSEGTETVAVGEIAVIKDVDGVVYFDAVLNGWYVSLQGHGFSRETQLAMGQWLASRFTPFPPASGTDAVAPTSAPLVGSLIDMQVTIESPAEVAGVTTLAALNASGFMNFSMCSTPIARPFVVTFTAAPVTDPPTPVSVFSVTAEQGVTAGQPVPVVISIGTGPSDMAQVTNWEGTAIVAENGASGTFEVPGQVKGSWTCTFAP
ncbi:MAG: hypothetical protein HZB18_11740 [Chloroflexi bacterium]|nr:hypothetical protein [Chloroflexota bacterium]